MPGTPVVPGGGFNVLHNINDPDFSVKSKFAKIEPKVRNYGGRSFDARRCRTCRTRRTCPICPTKRLYFCRRLAFAPAPDRTAGANRTYRTNGTYAPACRTTNPARARRKHRLAAHLPHFIFHLSSLIILTSETARSPDGRGRILPRRIRRGRGVRGRNSRRRRRGTPAGPPCRARCTR